MSHRDRTFPRPRQTPLKQVRAGWRSHAIPFLEARSRWASLYTVVLILATQRREYQLAQLREQLTLELAILSEQETAKVIQLLEESRRDNPLIRDRVDQKAEAIAQPADQQSVLDAIKETHAAGRRGKTPSRQAAAPWAEGLRPIPSSQPENKNSPRQLESEAGLAMESRARFLGVLGAAVLPQSENHIGQQQCCAFILHHTIFHKRGFSQINVTTRRRSTSSTGASRELRAMGYRKLSARPRHHAQAEGAIEDFKIPRPSGRDRARTESRSTRAQEGETILIERILSHACSRFAGLVSAVDSITYGFKKQYGSSRLNHCGDHLNFCLVTGPFSRA